RIKLLVSLVFGFICQYSAASGQEAPIVCKFNMVGTWQLTTEGHDNPTLLRFNPDGVVTVLFPQPAAGQGSGWQPTDWTTYKVDDPKDPKVLYLLPMKKNGEVMQPGQITEIEITSHDDGALTSAVKSNADVELTQWKRLDPYRYFIVMAADKGTPGYGAPAFAEVIKTDGRQSQVDAFGLYETDAVHHHVEVGPISDELRKKYEIEPRNDSAALLRLEVSAGAYQRALKIVKTWQRRARENTLLYQDIPYLNNAVYLNQLASTLNECGETIKLEKLTWRIDDPIITKQNLPQVPYFFIKKTRELNSGLHLSADKFHDTRQAINLPPRQ
ncbi:MAG TPA: hypothetical protein VGP65_08950, partial [Candidatus Angelobacter sp.]|nr:hypothetical protein [Candidatus Angelobacter sp.]